MPFPKTTVYLACNINDNRPVVFFHRNGPLANVLVTPKQYSFLTSEAQAFSVEVLHAVLEDGSSVKVKVATKFPAADYRPAGEEQAVAEDLAVQKAEAAAATAEAEAVATAEAEIASKELIAAETAETTEIATKAAASAETGERVNLLDTVSFENDEIQLNILTIDQYQDYTKEELKEFLAKVASALPEEAQKALQKNLSKKQLLEFIAANLIA